MKICNCKCGNCENDDHGHCEYECDEQARKDREFEEYGDMLPPDR
jgi:hypothetical protein